jgi:hypothetical protein
MMVNISFGQVSITSGSFTGIHLPNGLIVATTRNLTAFNMKDVEKFLIEYLSTPAGYEQVSNQAEGLMSIKVPGWGHVKGNRCTSQDGKPVFFIYYS